MQTFRIRFIATFVAAVFLITLRSTHGADIVSFNYAGYVTSISDPSHFLPGSITMNALITGTVTYDPNGKTDGFPPPDSTNGVYLFSDAGYSFTANIAGNIFTNRVAPVGANQVYVLNNFGGFEDYVQYLIRDPLLNGAPLPGPVAYAGMNVILIDDTGTAWPSDALPTAVPVLSKFNDGRLFEFGANATNGNEYVYSLSGIVTNITALSPIPPLLSVPVLKNGMVEFTYATQNGKSYRLQLNTNLVTTNWSDVQTNAGDGALITIQVNPILPQAFYRLLQE
jgi:hypothetical protein